MTIHENPRCSCGIACGLLKHGKLIYVDGLIFVDASFYMPAGKVASICSRESACAKSSNRRTLPVTVINTGGIFQNARVLKRKPQRALPGCIGNLDLSQC